MRYRKYDTQQQAYEDYRRDEEEKEAYKRAEEARRKARAEREVYWRDYEIRKRRFPELLDRCDTIEEAYILFGLSQTATDKDVKDAYRKLTKVYYPDKTFRDTNREMQVINQAFELIQRLRKK